MRCLAEAGVWGACNISDQAAMDRTREQLAVCAEHKAVFRATAPESKVGFSRSVREGLVPLNGLRLEPTGETSGWYIWAGEVMSQADDFFVPLHAAHLADEAPQVLKYLGLPPGWRFLIADDYSDVWFDPDALKK